LIPPANTQSSVAVRFPKTSQTGIGAGQAASGMPAKTSRTQACVSHIALR